MLSVSKIATKASKVKTCPPAALSNPPALKSARRSMSMDATPFPRTSDGKVWFGIGEQRSPAVIPKHNEDLPLDDHPEVQSARSGDYLTPRVRGEYAIRKDKNLFVINSRGLRMAPEKTPVESELGIITHTNLEPVAGIVAGELWASACAPWLWKINSGSKRFPLQDALVFNDQKLLWEVPPKGTAERACLDKQWEAVAAYMLTVGAAVVMQTPLDQRFEKNLDFKIFVREDILQQEMEIFMRLAPSQWKKAIKDRLQQGQASNIVLQSPQQTQSI